MYRRLIIVSVIILTAFAAFGVLGFHSISLHEDGLKGKRVVAFSEVAEKIRIDVKLKLDQLIQTEQKRSYTDYQYFYAPEMAQNALDGQNVLIRSPLAKSMSHGMAYGHFQIEPNGKIVTPFYAEGLNDKLDAKKKSYISNVRKNIAKSLKGNATAYLEIRRKELAKQNPPKRPSSFNGRKTKARLKSPVANSMPANRSVNIQKGNYNRANYSVDTFQEDSTQKMQVISKPRTVVEAEIVGNEASADRAVVQTGIANRGVAVKTSSAQQAESKTRQVVRDAADVEKVEVGDTDVGGSRYWGEKDYSSTKKKIGVFESGADNKQIAGNKKDQNAFSKELKSSEKAAKAEKSEAGLPEESLPSLSYVQKKGNVSLPVDELKTYGVQRQRRSDRQTQLPQQLESEPDQQQGGEMVQIRIEPFVPITVKAGANRDSYFESQIFIVRHLQIENSHYIQGFKLDEEKLIDEIRQSASQFVRSGMGFDISKTESPGAAHAAVLDFGFGQVVLNLLELEPYWIADQVSKLKNWYFAIVAIVFAATLIALASLWRNLDAQVKLARKKDDFISAVSHELRTPLTTIRMYTEMLEKNWVKTENKRKAYYGTMRQESERLSRLIENVLDFSRIQRGKKRYNFALGDINSCIKEVVEMMRPCAAKQDFTIETDLSDEIQSTSFDSDAIMQIVINLIDNALKYAAKAEEKIITVRTRTEGKYVLIEVADRGPGIPHTQRKKIFDEFYRIGDESKRESTGTGLGLALVKKFADAHNGFVEAVSAKPNGALFRVALAVNDPS